MRTAKRVIVATALGLPLLFGAPGMALADGHGHKKADEVQHQDQEQDNSTAQGNENNSPIYQWSVGKGDQSAQTWNNQSNDNKTDQDQDAYQED
ncbi:hypothetical protein [Saccharopolyspora taberi]|uniref:Secreted protein n=1 Tax=Saccharopolyspora taberi TaxID=60895 RepID=A0ABN3VE28_9PSEU